MKLPIVIKPYQNSSQLHTDITAMLQRAGPFIEKHLSELDSDDDLSTDVFPLAGCRGPIAWHVDDAKDDSVVIGLVLKSDGHVLHVDGEPGAIPLSAGDFYVIEPRVAHSTETDQPEGDFVFLASGHQRADLFKFAPGELACSLMLTFQRAFAAYEARQVQEDRDEKYRYRGISSHAP